MGQLCGFLVQFLGGLLAVREPAGCVHACSKWQTSVPELRAKFVDFFGYDPPNRASIRAEGKTAPSDDRGGDTDEGDARIGERLGDDTEHAAG